MGTDDAELFSLFFTHLSIHSGEHLFIGCLHAFRTETGNIRNFLRWISRIRAVIVEAALPNTTRYLRVNLILETVRQFCARFFSPVVKLVSFQR